MLDADGDEMVEKKEFFKVRQFWLFLVYHKTPDACVLILPSDKNQTFIHCLYVKGQQMLDTFKNIKFSVINP